jgi:hypothetical protein
LTGWLVTFEKATVAKSLARGLSAGQLSLIHRRAGSYPQMKKMSADEPLGFLHFFKSTKSVDVPLDNIFAHL